MVSALAHRVVAQPASEAVRAVIFVHGVFGRGRNFATLARRLTERHRDVAAVLVDLLEWMERLAPDGDSAYTHTAEGPDDMPAHLRSAVTRTNETLTVVEGALALGTWQGLYLWEHREHGTARRVTVTVDGE